MAGSIIGGLIASGHPASKIHAADPSSDSLARLADMGITTFAHNSAAIDKADVVILAIKPQVMVQVMEEIAEAVITARALVISIAAGITTASMRQCLGDTTAIVRCMPNTPALIGKGASALYATTSVNSQQRNYANHILAAVGIVEWVEHETQLDTITALSGSGPAYFFLLMEAMVEAACKLGLDRHMATRLTQQTALGAAGMAIADSAELAELRQRVTSPGGTTAAAIACFEAQKLREIVEQAMQAASDRAVTMAQEMG